MQTLAERIRALRGNRTVVEFAAATGVSRGALVDAESGQSIRISTLKRIASACGIDSGGWISLLISWIRVEVGEEDFCKLDVRPVMPGVVDDGHGEGRPELGEVIVFLFRQLSSREQVEIFKALTTPPIREGLSDISRLLIKHGHFHNAEVCQPSHPMINTPEKVQKVLRKLQEGDESFLWTGKCAICAGAPTHKKSMKKRLAGQGSRRRANRFTN